MIDARASIRRCCAVSTYKSFPIDLLPRELVGYIEKRSRAVNICTHCSIVSIVLLARGANLAVMLLPGKHSDE
jgi:hypothetical protein